jgi:hypothetical protein
LAGPLELDNKAIIFLDSEGLFASNVSGINQLLTVANDSSETYDAKIFSISTLLSSYLIYNTIRFIDQSSIDYIEYVSTKTRA